MTGSTCVSRLRSCTSRCTLRTCRRDIRSPKPDPVTPEWFEQTVPNALDAAIDRLGPRFHAIVVDEGQDFARDWLDSLYLMLTDPEHDVLYVFHDPSRRSSGTTWSSTRR